MFNQAASKAPVISARIPFVSFLDMALPFIVFALKKLVSSNFFHLNLIRDPF